MSKYLVSFSVFVNVMFENSNHQVDLQITQLECHVFQAALVINISRHTRLMNLYP